MLFCRTDFLNFVRNKKNIYISLNKSDIYDFDIFLKRSALEQSKGRTVARYE